MRRTGTILGTVALAAALGGCAPVSFAGGPALSIGLGSGPRLGLASPSCLLLGNQTADGVVSRSAAAVAHARMQQVSALQSKFMLGNLGLAMQAESWKRLAGGGC